MKPQLVTKWQELLAVMELTEVVSVLLQLRELVKLISGISKFRWNLVKFIAIVKIYS